MKKILSSIFILIMLGSSTSALDFGQLRFGLKASPSISWLNPGTTGYERDGINLGFSYGLIIDAPFSRSGYFSSGVFINHTGGKLSFTDIRAESLTNVSRNLSLSYLVVPATIKMRSPEFGFFTYYAKFGVGLGFQIGASATETFANTVRKVEDFNKESHFLNSSLIVGVGTEYAFGGKTSLMVGLAYNNGFMGVLKGEDNLGRARKATASYIEVSLGIIF